MSLVSKIQKVAAALIPLSENVYHYWRPRPDGVDQYIIWAEDSEENSLNGDNKKLEQGLHGTIDLFSKNEFDPLIDESQNAINGVENLSWWLNSSQYEDDTGLIHHEWEWFMR